MDGVCLSELPADVGVHKQGVIRTLLLTHDIHGLRSIDAEVLGKARHYAHYHVTIVKSLNVLTRPCNLLIPTKIRTFSGKFLFNFKAMKIRK